MALAAGSRLGPYTVEEMIGAGGMGEVYRARDTRVDREIAIKILPADLAADEDLKRRFEREARLIASLSHPHICTFHDVGQQDGVLFIVMEYLEGESLSHRLKRGPLPVHQALRYAVQIADALAHSHRAGAGIVHRDLKPGNIMLTKSGAKVLDFGLAKYTARPLQRAAVSTPTESDITGQDVLVGTFQYMAPEQLEAKELDARTDIFAFGAVLYEMLTAKPPFSGSSRAGLIGSIMNSEPPSVTDLQPYVPPALSRMVRTCLAKDPNDRWQTMQDVKLELEWLADAGSQAGVPVKVASRRELREKIAWAAIAVLLLAVMFLGHRDWQAIHAPATRLEFDVPAPAGYALSERARLHLSGDGSKLVLMAQKRAESPVVFANTFSTGGFEELSGVHDPTSPFVWSTDGKSIYFTSGNQLLRTRPGQAVPDTVCASFPYRIVTVNARGTAIALSADDETQAFKFAADSCSPEPLSTVGKLLTGFGIRRVNFLPDGEHFVFTIAHVDKRHEIGFGSLDGKEARVILRNAFDPNYAHGYLTFVRPGGFLYAQTFDAASGSLRGEAVQVSPTQIFHSALDGWADYTVSDSLLALNPQRNARLQLSAYDLKGTKSAIEGAPVGPYFNFREAPDGLQALISALDPLTHTSNLLTVDLRTGVQRNLTKATPGPQFGVWTPDGKSIVFAENDNAVLQIYRLDFATGEQRKVLSSATDAAATDISRDGTSLLVFVDDLKSESMHMRLLGLDGGVQKELGAVRVPTDDIPDARLSPNSQWVAFSAIEDQSTEIWLQSIASGARQRISTAGGTQPRWSPDGKELYYLDAKNMVNAVQVSAAAPSAPRPMFSIPADSHVEIERSGKRFLISSPVANEPVSVHVIFNWWQGLK